MSVGSIFIRNPYLAVCGPVLMSFFEIGRQILKFIFCTNVQPNQSVMVSPVAGGVSGVHFSQTILGICKSLIDAFTPQSFLIVRAISQQNDWMRNGRREKREDKA